MSRSLDHPPIRIGISSCLLGHAVRYDGGHKRDAFLTETVGRYVEWVPVCPEVESGMPVPREPIRLVTDGARIRLNGTRSAADYTDTMQRYAARRVRALLRDDLCGYVLKNGSPSCGMERVTLYRLSGAAAGKGQGLFAAALLQVFPHLPVEEEGRLSDPRLRENFIERIFAYRRLRSLFAGRWTFGKVVAFHSAHKLQLLAHSPAQYAKLDRLLARGKSLPRSVLRERYEGGFMTTLRVLATRARPIAATGIGGSALEARAMGESMDDVENEGDAGRWRGKSVARRFVSADGFVILVGRTASDNDILTFKIGRPQDVWMHVASESGSHVIVRNPDGLVRLPRATIQQAAALAARYSKAKDGGRVAVHVATCADVSKPRGLPPGKVVLRRHTTVHATPLRGEE